MKSFAFLDVDNTLLYNDASLNNALIQTLIDSGVKDVYLFTNMGLRDIKSYGQDGSSLSRYEIVKYLEQKGLVVHGVITPADTGYYDDTGKLKPIGTAYAELYKPLMERMIKNGPMDLEHFETNHEDIVDYLFNDLSWRLASGISREKTTKPEGELSKLPTPRIGLKDRKDGKEVKFRTYALTKSC